MLFIMMLSQIRLGNTLDSDSLDVDRGSSENIKGFSYSTFRDMESEYEHSCYDHPWKNNTDKKLANICCNVLINGDFNTEDENNYLIIEKF